MPTLIVEVFGGMFPYADRVGPYAEGELWGIFMDRSELMGWTTSFSNPGPVLWRIEEGELTFDTDGSQIGFVQVGLDTDIGASELDPSNPAHPSHEPVLTEAEVAELDEFELANAGWAPYPEPDRPPHTDPSVAIPPMLQCVDDSLRWFGEIEVSAFQVTGIGVSRTTMPHAFPFVSVPYWFNTTTTRPRARAQVTVAADVWNANMAADIAANLRRAHGRLFEIGPLTTAPPEYAAGPDMRSVEWARAEPSQAIAVSLPEWTPSAVGWIIAKLFDATLSHNPDMRNLSVRVTRSEGEAIA